MKRKTPYWGWMRQAAPPGDDDRLAETQREAPWDCC